MITIGVTAVGGGVGQNVIASLRETALGARIVGFDLSPWGVGVHECDVAYRVPPAGDPAYLPTLSETCRQERVALLIPGSDTELPFLAQGASGLLANGCRVLVSAPECVRVCRDKLATYRELAPRGAPIVETWTPEEIEPQAADLPYPLIAKPRSGSGSQGLVILMRKEDWARLPRHEPMVVQPYLFPAEWEADPAVMRVALEQLDRTREPIQRDITAIQVMADERGQLLGVFTALVNHHRGVPVLSRPITDQGVLDACRRTVEALAPLGLCGPANITGVLTRRGLLVFEINARFTGSTYHRALLGYDEVEAAVRYFALGQDRETVGRRLRPRIGQVALRQVHGHDIVVSEDRAQAFVRDGRLHNAARPATSSDAHGAGRRVIILGAGGHAHVVCELLRLAGYNVIGFLDDNAELHGTQVFGLPVLGPNDLVSTLEIGAASVGIGDNAMRQQWFERLTQLGIPLVNAIHPSAVIASNVRLGRGMVILPNTSLNVNACIGDNVVINTGAIVGHDCVIEDHAHIGPAAVLCGGARVGRGAFLGAGTIVIPYHAVGADSVVGAGSVVTGDLPDRVLAVGAPAKIVRPLTSANQKGALMSTTQRINSSAIVGAGQRVAVLGAGGHAKVVCEVLQMTGYEVVGFLDDNTDLHGAQVFGLPVLGPNDLVTSLEIDGAIVGIGDNAMRQQWFERLTQLGIPLVNAIDPRAAIASDVQLGRGAVVLANACIKVSSQVGDDVIINTGAIVGHDCVVEDHVHLSLAAVLCGGVRVGRGALIGAGAIVIPAHTVGAGSIVGAGSVVTGDLPERVVAIGAPARITRAL